ncbi:hypothetical protein OKA04_23250 [Luteolibacter flavescens]|uniref:Mycothiol-dependent maleylpyruvate isomerase metal-binding domain-containing protein n=1 Tax=Luteolibacter flavescens TaxID=1859460 RepID=A0ABT3FVQ6_9BACT|nr:hypothetical protein [Luteolibacter flavescens]MCW1887673.1 hypothetical protein [Luteolibacter flavescens]
MLSDEEIWDRIEEAADLNFRGERDVMTLDKEISMWLESHGILPSKGWDGWNSVTVLVHLMNLQRDLRRGHRRLERALKTTRLFPAWEIVWKHYPLWPFDPAPRPAWIEERWRTGLAKTTEMGTVCGERLAAIVGHPVWLEMSDLGRPFEPFLSDQGFLTPPYWEGSGAITIRPVGRRDAMTLGIMKDSPAIPAFTPWPGEGRLSLPEWQNLVEDLRSGRRGAKTRP